MINERQFGRGVLGKANQARRNAESKALKESMDRVGGAKIHSSTKRTSRSNDKRNAIRESKSE
jgi:hypothetical protein